MNKYQELLNMHQAELQKELEESMLHLQELYMGNRLKQLKETHKIAQTRHYIAQIKTALKNIPAETAAPAAVVEDSKPAEIETKPVKKAAVKKKATLAKKKSVSPSKK